MEMPDATTIAPKEILQTPVRCALSLKWHIMLLPFGINSPAIGTKSSLVLHAFKRPVLTEGVLQTFLRKRQQNVLSLHTCAQRQCLALSEGVLQRFLHNLWISQI